MQLIKNSLQKIESEKKIKILYACETGSRAWGFPSPDSDYDVRFIYIHPKDWYLSLNEKRDTIEKMEGDLDITGWDFRKSLLQLKNSNASLLERFNSPIEYMDNKDFGNEFRKLAILFYSPVGVFYHHYSLALKFWDIIRGSDEYKLKSFFYLIRSLLSCNWIINDERMVPMQIVPLFQYIDTNVAERFTTLINLKATVGEKYMHPKDAFFDNWINNKISFLKSKKYELKGSSAKIETLNNFFMRKLNDYDRL